MSNGIRTACAVCFLVAATLVPLDLAAETPSDLPDGELTPPQIILGTQKKPDYPPAAKKARYTGSVLVELTVQKDGTVGEVKVLECTRPKVGFEQATVDAIKKWRFVPGKRMGEPIEVSTQLRLNFTRFGVGVGQKDDDEMAVAAGTFTESRATSDAVSVPAGR